VDKRAALAVAVLFLVNVGNTIDRNVLSVLNEPIKRAFQLTDGAIGLLSTGFSVTYALAGLPLGLLADRGSRRLVIAGCVTVWSVATMLCGAAQSYAQLLLARLGVGAAESGSGPAALSLIADLYPDSRRATATSAYYLSSSVGFMLAMALGGWMAQEFGWRVTFLLAGSPVLLVLPLLLLAVREPARAAPARAGEPGGLRAFAARLAAAPALLWLIVGATVNVLVVSGLGAWMVSFLVRRHGAGLAETGLSIGLLHGVFGLLGTAAGGYLADRLARRDVRARLWLVAVACAATALLMIASLSAGSMRGALTFYAPFAFVSSIWLGPLYALSQSLAPVRIRATTASVLYIVTNVGGAGFGPVLVGLVSDRMGALGPALSLVALLNIVAALALVLAARTLAADLLSAERQPVCDAKAA
jgi:predicted MFS family arabinose efflux permease